jgi:hypothetical protein
MYLDSARQKVIFTRRQTTTIAEKCERWISAIKLFEAREDLLPITVVLELRQGESLRPYPRRTPSSAVSSGLLSGKMVHTAI